MATLGASHKSFRLQWDVRLTRHPTNICTYVLQTPDVACSLTITYLHVFQRLCTHIHVYIHLYGKGSVLLTIR